MTLYVFTKRANSVFDLITLAVTLYTIGLMLSVDTADIWSVLDTLCAVLFCSFFIFAWISAIRPAIQVSLRHMFILESKKAKESDLLNSESDREFFDSATPYKAEYGSAILSTEKAFSTR